MLGNGAFSNVIECVNLDNQLKFAIKVINKKTFKRSVVLMLTKEAEFLSSIKHPSVVRFKEHRESLNRVYLITELVEGITLTKLMRDRIITT
jgi:serine/threonine protein kinase